MGLGRRLASHSAVIFAARLFGAGLTFLAQAAIARTFGPVTLGGYMLIFATVNILAVIIPLGFETVGTYFAAEYRAKGEGRLLRGFVARAYINVAIVSLIMFFAGYPVAGLFGEPGRIVALHWAPACLLTLATGMVYVTSSLLVGLKHPFAGYFADSLFRPMAIIGAFLLGLLGATTEQSFSILIWGVALGYFAIAIGQLVFLLLALREVPTVVPARPREAARWWRFAAPWVLISLASDFFFDIDLLLLSNQFGHGELAIFGVCTRVFALVSFGVAAVYSVTLPDIFESEAKADRVGFHRKIGDANLVATGLSVLLFCGMAAGAPIALMIFGPAVLAGTGPLVVLCGALIVRSAFGPASMVLSVNDRPYAALPAIGLGIVALVIGNLLLVPPFGLMGAALAALASISLWSAAQWLTVWRVAKVDVSIMARRMRPRPAASSAPIG